MGVYKLRLVEKIEESMAFTVLDPIGRAPSSQSPGSQCFI